MNFIKKNWGLLLCAVIFLCALTYLLLGTFDGSKKIAENVKAIQEVNAKFTKLNSDGWKVTKDESGQLENTEIAERNKELATGRHKEIVDGLHDRYHFDPYLPQDSNSAKDLLQEELQNLTEEALEHGIEDIGGEPLGGRLVEISQMDGELKKEDFPAFFRQLMIYKMIVRHLENAGVKIVNELDFPRGWGIDDSANEYTITPIVLDVQADAKTLQTLVNNMTNDTTMLFFIRNMSFTAVNAEDESMEFTQKVNERRAKLDLYKEKKQSGNSDGMGGVNGTGMRSSGRSGRSSTRASSGRSGRMDKMDMSGGSSRRSSRRSGRMDSMGSSGTGNGYNAFQDLVIDEAWLVYEDPKRENYFVFRPDREIEMSISLDLIEFKPREEEESEEVEELEAENDEAEDFDAEVEETEDFEMESEEYGE